MTSSISLPISGRPAQDLGGAKQDPKASQDTGLIKDPGKNLEKFSGVQIIHHENARELGSREENDTQRSSQYTAGGPLTQPPSEQLVPFLSPGRSTFVSQASVASGDVSGSLDPLERINLHNSCDAGAGPRPFDKFEEAEVASITIKKFKTKKDDFISMSDSISQPNETNITTIDHIISQSEMAINSLNPKEIFKELSLFDHPSNESSSSYELFCRTTIQLEEDNLFNFIRMKISRNISPENEKELFFDSYAQKICQLIINDSREFSHKVLILIRKNMTSSNLKVIYDFISQNFDQIIHNNEKQFLEL
jgi:hypothetical protein